jgi:hypothetical protein
MVNTLRSFQDKWHENPDHDWYHLQECSRHTLDEVLGWYAGAGLEVVHQHVDPYGITVRGQRAG